MAGSGGYLELDSDPFLFILAVLTDCDVVHGASSSVTLSQHDFDLSSTRSSEILSETFILKDVPGFRLGFRL